MVPEPCHDTPALHEAVYRAVAASAEDRVSVRPALVSAFRDCDARDHSSSGYCAANEERLGQCHLWRILCAGNAGRVVRDSLLVLDEKKGMVSPG